MISSTTTSPASFPSSPCPQLPRHSHNILLRQPPCSLPAVLSLSASQSSLILLPITVRISSRSKCIAKSATSGDQLSDSVFSATEEQNGDIEVPSRNSAGSTPRKSVSSSSDLLSLGIPEPVYEVVEVRENAILLNLGSLRAIVMQEHVLIFNYNRKGGKAFIESLLPRLNPRNTTGGPCMPFVLEVVEAALVSRIQQLEQRMMDLEPHVQDLLDVLPKRLAADALEQLRTSKQTLVELGSKAGALRQMLLDLLDDTMEIHQICIMGRKCTINSLNHSTDSSLPLDKQIAEEEQEEIEMLLENYLQRCESCHGQAEKLLDSAKEMEDSIAVNLSSRRLEVSKVELLLQIGAFVVAVGALIAGIFGMNLKCHIEDHVLAFCLTTTGIVLGMVVGFYVMCVHLRRRRIL